MTFEWTDETIKSCIALYRSGWDASSIANQIGAPSRNSVLGKMFREGISSPRGHRGNYARTERQKRPRVERRSAPKIVRPPAFQPEALPLPCASDVARVSLVDLEPHHCRFPVGEPGSADFWFCGEKRHAGLSYCIGHAVRCYSPPKPKPVSRVTATKVLETA